MQERNKRNKAYGQFRKIFDISMGLLYIFCGIFAIMAKKMGYSFNIEASFGFFLALGIVLILYGAYRIYRGFKHIF